MKALISMALLGLVLCSGAAVAKNDNHDKDKNKGKGSLPPGLQKKVDNGGQLPPGWQKKYHKGDRLDDDIYRHGRVIKPIDRDGRITIEVDDTIIHMVHDTREILSILSRYN
ncbi:MULTISPECIES: hypothetical protein [Pseudoalteromonas]|jgi:hypothetical protein|uniref:hypothetical protein n=1 Tax=Pseudoalteromonas TaxID=53246 RepID=UPI0007E4FA5F|nr:MULTISPECIES: hypothetical protein [Pseudoalteromonas]MBE0376302.1 hypothetical protein [Pseudoalteromonas prydzensis ACAM 620]WKD24966.1 hypothetical protein NDQ71_07865 [Pseudoalteromonas sp. KG3]